MIEKIIDKYFAKKLKKCISTYLLHWYIDSRFVNRNDYIELQIKKPHYKEEIYTTIYGFYKPNSLFYLLEIEKINEKIKECVNSYLEDNKW